MKTEQAEVGMTGTELAHADYGALGALQRSEIDVAIATAKRFPRSITTFRKEMMEMVTLSDKVAEECIYAIPREGKSIEGPSARFAEIAASAWGNCRAGARALGEDADFITAQGFFFDVERNVQIAYEVKRRIVDKYGRKYSPDMIGVTTNAACSIALRNAILKGIPKAFWAEMYDAARNAAIGTAKTLTDRRAEMVAYFQKMGINEAAICAALEVEGLEDVGLDELGKLKGMATAIKEGDTTIEEAFPGVVIEQKKGRGASGLKDKLAESKTERKTEGKPIKKTSPTPGAVTVPAPPPATTPPVPATADSPPPAPPAPTPPPAVTVAPPPPPPPAPAPEAPPGAHRLSLDSILPFMAGIRATKTRKELEDYWKNNIADNKMVNFMQRTQLSAVYNEMFEMLKG